MKHQPRLSVPGNWTTRVLFAAAVALGVLAGMAGGEPGGASPAPQGAVVEGQAPSAGASETATVTARVEAHRADPEEGAVPAPDAEAVSAAATEPANGRFSMPLASWVKVTDRYGAARGAGLVHGGIDLALDGLNHTVVVAACSGSVAYTGYSSTYGNHVIIDCGAGYTTLYGHLSSIAVAKGATIESGTKVGISGSTGFSTGEHLHFEIRFRDTPVNPENYLEFHIAPGTPLSDGPIWFAGAATSTPTPAPAALPTATPTFTPTATPTFTPTATPTFTPTATPTPKAAKKTATPPSPLQ